jgi:FkbM family methyltransferase
MRNRRVIGVLRQFVGLQWRYMPAFLKHWLGRKKTGLVPWAPPGAKQLFVIPKDAYYSSYWFFSESSDGRKEVDYFCRRLRPQDCIFDVGSYRGAYSLAALAATGGTATIAAFEPVATNADAIRAILAANGIAGVKLVEMAVGDGSQLASEYDPDSAMMRAPHATSGAHEFNANFVSLDTFCADHNASPTVIKIDVDGFELKVLEGATKCLSEARPRLWIEVHPGFLRAQGVTDRDVHETLSKFSYRITEFADAHTKTADISYHLWAEPS